MVNARTLRRLYICPAGLARFKSRFPNGARSWSEMAEDPEFWPDDRGWIATFADDLPLPQRQRLIEMTERPAFWRGHLAAYGSGLGVAARRELVESSDRPAFWSGQVALFAPELDRAERDAFAASAGIDLGSVELLDVSPHLSDQQRARFAARARQRIAEASA